MIRKTIRRFNGKMGVHTAARSEIARVLVCFDHVAQLHQKRASRQGVNGCKISCNRLHCSPHPARLITADHMMSSIGDRHLNLRYRSRFEPPPSKRVGRDLIEKLITRTFCHCCTGNVATRGIDGYKADAGAGSMGAPRFVRIIGKRGANCHSFCGR